MLIETRVFVGSDEVFQGFLDNKDLDGFVLDTREIIKKCPLCSSTFPGTMRPIPGTTCCHNGHRWDKFSGELV